VNSVGLAEIAGARTDGMNVRSDHPDLARLFAAAHGAREAAGRRSWWDASVWAVWDEALLDPAHPQRRHWEELGINRLILVWFDRFDVDALQRATSRLAVG